MKAREGEREKETGLKGKNAKPTGCRGVRRADQRGQTRMSGGRREEGSRRGGAKGDRMKKRIRECRGRKEGAPEGKSKEVRGGDEKAEGRQWIGVETPRPKRGGTGWGGLQGEGGAGGEVKKRSCSVREVNETTTRWEETRRVEVRSERLEEIMER